MWFGGDGGLFWQPACGGVLHSATAPGSWVPVVQSPTPAVLRLVDVAQINRDAANGCLFKFCHRRREMPNDACDDNDDRATRESRCCRLWLLQCRAQGKRKGFPRPTLHPGMPGRPAPPPSFGKTGATSQSARLLQASLAGRATAPRDTLFFELGWSPPRRLCAGGFASDPTTRTDRQPPQVLTALLLGAHKTRHAIGSQFRFGCRRSRLPTTARMPKVTTWRPLPVSSQPPRPRPRPPASGHPPSRTRAARLLRVRASNQDRGPRPGTAAASP